MALLDAVPCSWSACYTTPNALTVKIAVNIDNKILTFDGTYWKTGSLYLKNHTLTGNTYTTSTKEALNPPSGAVGFAIGANVWYGQDRNFVAIWDIPTADYCSSLGWSNVPPSFTNASIVNGVPPNPLGTTWSITAYTNYVFAWNNGGIDIYHYSSEFFLRCMK